MSTNTSVLKAVIEHLVDRGMTVTANDERELAARIAGYASAQAKIDFDENAKKFAAYRLDPSDYDQYGVFSGSNTRENAPVFQGALDEVYNNATVETMTTLLPFVIYDGNGKLTHMLEKSDVDLAVYVTAGVLKNAAADFVVDLADNVEKISGGVFKWPHVAQDVTKGAQLLLRRGTAETKGKSLVVAAVQHTGKVLWRKFV